MTCSPRTEGRSWCVTAASYDGRGDKKLPSHAAHHSRIHGALGRTCQYKNRRAGRPLPTTHQVQGKRRISDYRCCDARRRDFSEEPDGGPRRRIHIGESGRAGKPGGLCTHESREQCQEASPKSAISAYVHLPSKDRTPTTRHAYHPWHCRQRYPAQVAQAIPADFRAGAGGRSGLLSPDSTQHHVIHIALKIAG